MQLPAGGKITHIDFELMRLRMKLPPAQRIAAMLETHEFIISVTRARLKRQRPELSDYEIGLLVIEEFERAKRHEFRLLSLLPGSTKT